MSGRLGPRYIQTRLQRVAKLAREAPKRVLSTLAHHIDIYFLYEAMLRVRKDGAVGVDGVTAKEYMENAEENLRDLHERFKSGRYKAPPVRRKHIPKGDGTKTRPIGIPTFEDKILQRAVEMIMSAVYEQEFLDCSFGFRKGKNQHQALAALWSYTMKMRGGWILEVDIKGFFDNLRYNHLRDFLDQRVSDGVIRRSIDKWLKAGVMEEGIVTVPEAGTPQGGVISPVLSNIYLHKVVDEWFRDVVKPKMYRAAEMVRFADDIVMVFTSKRDAVRVHKALQRRMEKHGLELHAEKTRLIPFERPASKFWKPQRSERPGSFDFLGFTHFWGKSRKGNWVVKRKTAKDRLKRALRRVDDWCKKNRHLKVKEQHRQLSAKVQGHYGYYGTTGNRSVLSYFHQVKGIWRKWLNRRSQGRHMPWKKFSKLLEVYSLPTPCLPRSVFKA